jgi:hypothetical protein
MIAGTAMMNLTGLAPGRVQAARPSFLPIHRGQTATIRTHQVEEHIPEEADMEEVHMQVELQDYHLDLEHREREVWDFLWVQDQGDNRLGV